MCPCQLLVIFLRPHAEFSRKSSVFFVEIRQEQQQIEIFLELFIYFLLILCVTEYLWATFGV